MRAKKLKRCPECGLLFETENTQKVYCTPKCQKIHNNRATNEEAKIRRRRKCWQCGAPLEGQQRKYCSAKCRDRYYKGVSLYKPEKDRCECTRKSTCKYGTRDTCEYLLITGHTRPGYPDGNKCEVYQRRRGGTNVAI